MVMLSDFLRFRLTDRQEQHAQLTDVAVDLAAGDYPCVDQLLIRLGRPRKTVALAWSDVASIDWRRRRILVDDVQAGSEAPLTRGVLARRDILDALIVDVGRRHTLRANDLWFREQDGQLWLAGADASPWAVLRRLGRGVLGRGAERRLVDWRDLEFLRGDPDAARQGHDYHRQITRLQPAEIARLLDALPYLHAAELLTLIDDPIAADTLETMSPERQTQVIQVLDQDRAVRLLSLMAPEAAADLFGYLVPARAQRLLAQVPAPRRDLIVELLRYPDDTAGGIMTNELVCVRAAQSVGDARRDLKDYIASPDFANYLYVIDSESERHLEGVVSLRDFSVAEDDTRIGSLMRTDVTSIDALEPARTAARHVADEQLAALPVTSRDGRLLGAVTVDMAMAQLAPAAWRDQAPRVFS
ncbi:MAG: magnesium transporter [Chloroflexi bacterium]|nr:magnesium transporter [Chloroflexota bacterium]